MKSQMFFRHAAAASAVILFASSLFGQVLVKPVAKDSTLAVATGNNLYCAGYVQTAPIDTSKRLIGAWNEQDGSQFTQGNYVYISLGAGQGAQPGDLFSVVRPKGPVHTKWTSKSGLGFYVQEVGTVEIVRAKQDHAVGRIKTSCDSFLLGDVVVPAETRTSDLFTVRPAMDPFGDPSGKPKGHIFMARDGQELVTRDQIVYVDLGKDDNVQAGDRLTIFRKVGKGNYTKLPENPESIWSNDYGFHSLEYSGGTFSNQAQRKEGSEAKGSVVTTPKAKQGRPDLRKVVGEGVVVNVKEKTATVVIVRTGQEIHTGDEVEVQ